MSVQKGEPEPTKRRYPYRNRRVDAVRWQPSTCAPMVCWSEVGDFFLLTVHRALVGYSGRILDKRGRVDERHDFASVEDAKVWLESSLDNQPVRAPRHWGQRRAER